MSKHTVAVEVYYGGAWHDLAAAGLVRRSVTVSTSRSGANQTTKPTAGETKVRIASALGEYNPANPLSALYGSLARNIPMRISVDSVVRWIGEASEWKAARILGGDRYTDITGGGILRRLMVGNSPALSAILSTVLAMTPMAYWPLNDDSLASIGANVIAGAPGLSVVPGVISLAKVDGPTGDTAKLPELASAGGGSAAFTATPTTTTGNSWTIECVIYGTKTGTYSVMTPLALETRDAAIALTAIWTSGGATQVMASIGQLSGTGNLSMTYASLDVFDGQWHQVRISIHQSGGTASAELFVDGVSGDTASDTFVPGPVGEISILAQDTANVASASIGHITLYDVYNPNPTYQATLAYPGEIAYVRFARVCSENGITTTVYATGPDDSHTMGPQPKAKLVDILYDCAVVDGGIMYESATTDDLVLKCYGVLCNQNPVLTIDVNTDLVPDLDPTIGDRNIRNKVTAKKPTGSSATFELTAGPMGTQPPPAGVGVYDTQVDVNPELDSRLRDYASWLVSTMTYQGITYGQITLDLDAHALDTTYVDIGAVVQLTGIPVYDDPNSPLLLVMGMGESTDTHRRKLTLIVVPAEPYTTEILDTGGYLDCGATLTTETLDTTETGVDTVISDTCVWTHASGNYDILIGGELMTVTAISAVTGAYPIQYQTLTVTRSVNGVVKSHAVGSEVHVANPVILAL